jgi:hypothetical protein
MNDSGMVCRIRLTPRNCLVLRGQAKFFARSLASLLLAVGAVSAQQADQAPVQPSTTLASQFFEHDFINVFAFGNGLYDTELPQLTPSGSNIYGGAWGYDVGGGLTGGHNFKDGVFSISYRGDYRHYQNNGYGNGTNQNLALLFTKRLSRHWSVQMQGGGGIISYGGEFYTSEPTAGPSVLTNPLSSSSRYANAGATLTYEQTRRLSYTFGGQFFYNSYNYSGAFSSKGLSGTVSANYRTTARTTVGATYSRSYFTYGGALGSTTIDGGFLTLSHLFPQHWTISLSAGIDHTHAHGVITQPIELLIGQQLVTGFITGPYNTSSNSPSYQGTISRNMHHSSFAVSGGQGVNAGNGTYLTSKDQFVSTTYSLTRRLTNLSFGGGYTRLTSIANTITNKYSTATFSVSYGFNLVKYVSADLRYDFVHYDNLFQLNGLNESRFTFGFSFSSKSVPLTLF